MQAMPFNLQETVSGEREFEEFQVSISNSTTKLTIEGDSKSSPVDSEPTSTLDSTPSPSPPAPFPPPPKMLPFWLSLIKKPFGEKRKPHS